jgi:hypothetical protein
MNLIRNIHPITSHYKSSLMNNLYSVRRLITYKIDHMRYLSQFTTIRITLGVL